MDGNIKLQEFAEKLETACVSVVDAGKMTKDLAILTHGPKYVDPNSKKAPEDCCAFCLKLVILLITSCCFYPFIINTITSSSPGCLTWSVLDHRVTKKDYLNTEEFIDAVAEELKSKL